MEGGVLRKSWRTGGGGGGGGGGGVARWDTVATVIAIHSAGGDE